MVLKYKYQIRPELTSPPQKKILMDTEYRRRIMLGLPLFTPNDVQPFFDEIFSTKSSK